MPLRDGKSIGQRAVELGGARTAAPILIGSGYMPTHLRQAIIDGIGGDEPVQDATQQLWTLMRRTSSYELLAIRDTCLALTAAMQAIAGARRTGAGPATAVLAGERAANARGAQDVRTLYSVNGGRTLQPFTSAEDVAVDPLQVYVAVRRFNYWAEGFAHMTEWRLPVAEKANELLRMAQLSIKAGFGTA